MDELGANLLRYKDKQLYLILDTETESLNLYFSRPWQLSFAVYEGKNLIEEHDYLLDWPDLNISADAKRITRFDQFNYDSKKIDPNIAIDHLEKFLYNEKYKIVGANILCFDTYQLNTARRCLGKKPDYSYINRIYDTHLLQKAIILGIKPDLNNFLAWQYKLSTIVQRGLKTSQSACAKYYDIKVDETGLHDALNDIRLNKEIFFKQLYQIEI